MKRLLRKSQSLANPVMFKLALFVVASLLFTSIHQDGRSVLPFDPISLLKLIGVDVSSTSYGSGEKAALGTILSSLLLLNTLPWHKPNDENVTILRILDRAIGSLTVVVVFMVGFNWLSAEASDETRSPYSYISPVANSLLSILIVASTPLIMIGMFFIFRHLSRWTRGWFRKVLHYFRNAAWFLPRRH